MVTPSKPAKAALAELRAVAEGPRSAARTMSPAMYHDAEIAQLELDRIFSTDWVSPGMSAEVANPGDYLTFEIANQPVYVLRQPDGDLKAFSNVCRHRMMVLLEGRGALPKKNVICPYHAWTYDPSGNLVGAGHMNKSDDFDRADHCLPEIRLEEWHGWIYLTLNADATPIAELLAPMEPFVERYQVQNYVPVVHLDEVWNTNWKFLTENFMEGYHLPVAHRETVGAWMPPTDVTFPDEQHEAFTYQIFIKDETATYGRAHPDNTRLEDEWRYLTFMPTIFPSHMYILAPDHVWYLSLRPAGVDHVALRFGIALAPEVHADLEKQGELDAYVKEMDDFFGRVNLEDKAVVEGIHRGSAAPDAEAGPLSWLEHELHDLMGYLARRLSS